jgi:uncharacterized membrane protein
VTINNPAPTAGGTGVRTPASVGAMLCGAGAVARGEETSSVQRRARRLALLCYAAQAAGVLLYVAALWLEVYVDTRRQREVAVDAFTESHRHWRLRTTLLFLTWTVLGGLTLPLGFGVLFLIPAYAWYVYRVTRGAFRFCRGAPAGPINAAVTPT